MSKQARVTAPKWPCTKCGGADFTAEIVDVSPEQQDMVLTCLRCERQRRLVNVVPTSFNWGETEADGYIITDVTTLKCDKGVE